MFLISNEEMKELEEVRKQLTLRDYIINSHETSMLYRIINRKRGIKYIIRQFLNKG